MSIIASYMVPHPPLIVSEVGKGNEEKIKKTSESYMRIAEEIATLNPETIIISSPHTLYYNDCFFVSGNNNMKGSFSNFGAPNVSFDEEIDLDLVNEIKTIAQKKGFPISVKNHFELDHGTMVPLYFIRKKLPKTKIIVVGLSSLPLLTNYQFGMIIREAVDITSRKVVFIASGDLSHKLQEYGPYGFVEEGPIYDKKIMKTMSLKNFNELLEYDEDFLDKAAECGHRSFTIMAGLYDGYNVEAKEYSHEDITGVGYGICSFKQTNKDNNRLFRDKYIKSEDECVNLAKKSLTSYIFNEEIIEVPSNISDYLINEVSGTFVSIHKFGALRGCIGTILPTRKSIAEEIIINAIAAGTRDYRFLPIEKEELADLEINVDILTTPEDIETKEMLNPKVYGVIVTQGQKRGLLLPDLEGIESVEDQINIAKKKAGIITDEYSLKRFKVIRHK